MSKVYKAYINHKILQWARSESPLSLSDVAFLSKQPVDRISLWERGEDLPSVNQAKNLAKIYDVPFAALYLSDIPQSKRPRIKDHRVLPGAGTSTISYELWKEIRYFISLRETAAELVETHEVINIKFAEISVKSSDVGTIANLIRYHLGIKTPYVVL